MTNVRFQFGDVYELHYPNSSFDVAWTSSLMQWLDKPITALREIHRVLKPGGVYGVRDRGRSGDICGNLNPPVRKASISSPTGATWCASSRSALA